MSEKQRLAFVRAGLVLLPLVSFSLLGCGGGQGQPFGGGGFLGRGGGSPGTGGITGSGGETAGGGATGSGSGGAGVGGKIGTGGGVAATGGIAAGGSSAGGAGGGDAGGRATGGSGAGGKAAGGSGAGGKGTGGTSGGGAGGKASGGAPGTGGAPMGGNGGHAAGGAGGAGGSGAGTGGSGPDCATLASQYDAELQKNARNCTTNTANACAVKVPQNLTCMSSCITFVEDSSGRLQKIYTSWQDAGCAKRTMICPTLIACVNPRGATCVANITTSAATGSGTAAAPVIGLPGTCQDDTGATTQ